VVSVDKPVRRVAVVGTGVIGASWAAQYLARGFDVVATVPAPNAEVNLRNYAFRLRRQGRGSDAAWTGSA
jgi:3-hydroxyacyl-CoA dehydrogenase